MFWDKDAAAFPRSQNILDLRTTPAVLVGYSTKKQLQVAFSGPFLHLARGQ